MSHSVTKIRLTILIDCTSFESQGARSPSSTSKILDNATQSYFNPHISFTFYEFGIIYLSSSVKYIALALRIISVVFVLNNICVDIAVGLRWRARMIYILWMC